MARLTVISNKKASSQIMKSFMQTSEVSSPEPILQTAMGFMAAKHLLVANEIGLFTVLKDRSCTLDEVAAQTQVPKRTARIIADAMVALGFLQKEDMRTIY